MTEAITCPRCGRTRPGGTASPLGDGCPYCLLLLTLGDADSATPPEPPSAATETAAPPQRIGPYRLHEKLGSGGMGIVYRAVHESLGRTVALKVLHPQFVTRTGFLERFQHEGRILAGLEHPQILGIHDVGCDGGFYFLATEFVEGQTLRARMDHGPISVPHAVAICSEICDGLQYAHRRGVVHRDVKPGNVLLDTAGRVKIADFGVAKLVDLAQSENTPVTETGAVLGTLRYMAPEQLEASRTIDHRADIYAVATVLYEMLTGELPLGVFAPPSRRPGVDPRLDAPILAALAKDPKARPQSAAEFRQRLASALRPPASHNRRWVLGIGAAAIAGAAATEIVRRISPPPLPGEPDLLAKYGATRLAHPARVWGVAFHPQQSRLATACEDGRVRLWNVGDSREPASSFIAYPKSEFGYLAVAFSPDGKTIATAGGENVARLWDAESGKERITLSGHSREIVAVRFSPDGKWMATAGHDRTVRLWNAADGKLAHTFGPLEDPTLCVAFSPDGTRLAAGLMNGGIRVWNLESRELVGTLGHARRVWALAYEPAPSNLLVSGSHDKTLKFWSPQVAKAILDIPTAGEVWSIATFADHHPVLGLDDGSLQFGSLAKNGPSGGLELRAPVKAHTSSVVSVAFSYDGTRLATGSLDRSAVIWDAAKLFALA